MKDTFFRGMITLFILSLILLIFAPKVMVGIVMLIFMIPFAALLVSFVGIVMMVFFPDAIKQKENSRLLRIPALFNSCVAGMEKVWHEAWDFLDIVTSQRRMRETMDEIRSGQSRLPF